MKDKLTRTLTSFAILRFFSLDNKTIKVDGENELITLEPITLNHYDWEKVKEEFFEQRLSYYDDSIKKIEKIRKEKIIVDEISSMIKELQSEKHYLSTKKFFDEYLEKILNAYRLLLGFKLGSEIFTEGIKAHGEGIRNAINQAYTQIGLDDGKSKEKLLIKKEGIIQEEQAEIKEPEKLSETKEIIKEFFDAMDNKGWHYAFKTENNYLTFVDYLTTFFDEGIVPEKMQIIETNQRVKMKLALVINQIYDKKGDPISTKRNDFKFWELLRCLKLFRDKNVGEIYKAITRAQ
jgi:hypothetical protein